MHRVLEFLMRQKQSCAYLGMIFIGAFRHWIPSFFQETSSLVLIELYHKASDLQGSTFLNRLGSCVSQVKFIGYHALLDRVLDYSRPIFKLSRDLSILMSYCQPSLVISEQVLRQTDTIVQVLHYSLILSPTSYDQTTEIIIGRN